MLKRVAKRLDNRHQSSTVRGKVEEVSGLRGSPLYDEAGHR